MIRQLREVEGADMQLKDKIGVVTGGGSGMGRAAALAMAREFDRRDPAFNNAGGHADMKPIDQTSEEEPGWVIDLNFKAVYHEVKYEGEFMLKGGGGRIVNNASTFGLKAMPGIAHYTASKFAVVGLTRSVALEYASRNIRVNAICPGATGGDALAFGNFIPMHRIRRPEEVAEAVECLMSDKTSYATGSVLSIDGGMYAG